MLQRLEIKNFKAFEAVTLNLSPLTILSGLNSSGKSTILQTLILLKQSYGRGMQDSSLLLNGVYQKLGVGFDVLYEKAVDDMISISLVVDGKRTNLSYQALVDSSELRSKRSRFPSKNMQEFTCTVHYLSSQRIAPSPIYDQTGYFSDDILDFGPDGRLAVGYLSDHFNDTVVHPHLCANNEDTSLSSLTNYWMSYISPDVRVEPIINRKSQTVELYYSYEEGTYNSRSHKSTNVGFGLTGILPIIVQLLTAKQGDILIFENPEAYIHPAGQSKLGKMFAAATADGIQIIVETHSDHLINGVRIAVADQTLKPNDVGIKYCYRDEKDSYCHKVKQLNMNSAGQLDEWPEGFMDEWDKDLYKLILGGR